MKNKSNWFWGLFFILAAIFVVASQTGGFVRIGFVSVVATVLLVALLIKAGSKGEFFGIFLSIALLYLIYQQPLALPYVSFWLLLVAAVFLSIGLSLLLKKSFPPHPHGRREDWEHACQSREDIDDNYPHVQVSFGSSSKYLRSDQLSGGHFSVSFGALSVFFDQVVLAPGGAEIQVDCSFGEIELFVPRTWRVIEHLRTSLGAVENKARPPLADADAPELTISGNVTMGQVEIHYI